MPQDAEKMRKAEREIGENIPEEMKGLDTEDVGEVGARPARGAKGAREADDEAA